MTSHFPNSPLTSHVPNSPVTFPVPQHSPLVVQVVQQTPINSFAGPMAHAPAFPVPQIQTYGTASAPVTMPVPSLYGPSMSSPGHVKAAEETRREILAAWTEVEGKIPVLDKDRDPWTLIFYGTLAINSLGGGNSWQDGFGVLSDSHFFLFKKETTPTGTIIKYTHMINPIPLKCLRVEPRNDNAVDRKMDVGLFNRIGSCFRSPTEKVYPFTIYHSAARTTRQHTLYASSSTERNRWHSELVDVIKAQQIRHEKELYTSRMLDESSFRTPPRFQTSQETHFTGQVLCAVEFLYQERHYLAVGCTNGIYVRDRKGHSPPRRVLESDTPTSIVAVPEFHKFLVLCESNLLSYPLDLLVRVSQAQGGATSKDLYDEEEKLNEAREDVLFFKAGHMASRAFSEQLGHISSALYLISKKVVYAAKNGKKVTSQLRELLPQNPVKYERLGSPMPTPGDPHDATFFADKVAICTSDTLYIVEDIVDPTKMVCRKLVLEVTAGKNLFSRMLQGLKSGLGLGKSDIPNILELIEGSTILGSVRCGNDTLIVYDAFGCFVDDHGKPARSTFYVPWEATATAFAHRDDHLFLFSPSFIEVRSVQTGKLVQIMEMDEMQLLQSGSLASNMIIAAMPSRSNADGGRTERLVELVSQ
ncbi:CNH domain-containing protein [Russula earlei]|uniref:CNH domain-containing protein n=1 Tax=Russula earlei TaxID=71964 RepID=A0ACC0ULL9_9AGAM|nr:CNH domain-containing protein [Russula earlei]